MSPACYAGGGQTHTHGAAWPGGAVSIQLAGLRATRAGLRIQTLMTALAGSAAFGCWVSQHAGEWHRLTTIIAEAVLALPYALPGSGDIGQLHAVVLEQGVILPLQNELFRQIAVISRLTWQKRAG